ncbi:MAG: hypothetical protein HY929_05595 [Euryarchaeota archaeon]|nr:hypothetical protein [Euryarchaeota archaeon]
MLSKVQILECCGINRHLNAALNILKTQNESLRFRLDRSSNVALIAPLNKGRSKRGEAAGAQAPILQQNPQGI